MKWMCLKEAIADARIYYIYTTDYPLRVIRPE